MKERFIWIVAVVVAVFIGLFVSCDCGDDDDDDDDLGGNNGDGGSGNCTEACDNAFDCGAVFWYEEKEECLYWCNEWLETSLACADCFLACWTTGKGCASAGLCMADCALDECLEDLEDLDNYV